MPVSYEEYVKALEKCLADHVISREEMQLVDANYSSLLNMEVNGLAMALRMTGLYGTTAFDIAWATSPDRPEVPWQGILDAGYYPTNFHRRNTETQSLTNAPPGALSGEVKCNSR